MANNSISSAFIVLPKVLWKGWDGSPVESVFLHGRMLVIHCDTHELF